jgi:hypothetical protein
MKSHIFERACPLYQEGAVTPIFEGDMPPLKKRPKKWPQYWGHSWSPVKIRLEMTDATRNK